MRSIDDEDEVDAPRCCAAAAMVGIDAVRAISVTPRAQQRSPFTRLSQGTRLHATEFFELLAGNFNRNWGAFGACDY